MLIPSPRHRPEDLEIWREMEAADKTHAASLRRSGKIDRSVFVIRQFVKEEKCFIGWSGGKDSTALLGLVEQARMLDELPVVWLRAVPKFNPDIPTVKKCVEDQFGITIEVRDYVSPVPTLATREAVDRVATKNFHHACDLLARDYGKRLTGIRADESPQRRLRMKRWGLASTNSLCPLGWWDVNDVFAYLADRDLPVHPAYAMLGGGRWPRDRIRVDALFGERGDGSGRTEWERDYYGDVLRRLESGR